MRFIYILLALFALAGESHSQTVETVWERNYDFRQNANSMYRLNNGVVTSDSHFVLIGYCAPEGSNNDIFIMKINMDGDTIWTKCEGDEQTNGTGMKIIETSDSNLVALGVIQGDGNFGRVRLYKITPGGDIIWEKTYLAETDYTISRDIVETSCGGLIITGECENNLFVFKTDSNGDSLWGSYFGGDYYDRGYGVAPATNGGVIVSGFLSSADIRNFSILLLRVDSFGDTIWERKIPFTNDQQYYGYIKMYRNAEGDYILITTNRYWPIYWHKFDEDGNILNASTINYRNHSGHFGICEGNDNSTYLTGINYSDEQTLVGKTDLDGDSVFTAGVNLAEPSTGCFIYKDEGEYIYVAGRLYESHTIYFAKLKETLPATIDNGDEAIPSKYKLAQNYPNPFNPATNIKYTVPSRSHVTIGIFNLLGKRIATLVDETKSAGEYQVLWNGKDFNDQDVSTGVYFYRFQSDGFLKTKKMLLLK